MSSINSIFSNSSSTSDFIAASLGTSSVGNIIGEHKSIQNGSYYKLLKAYYASDSKSEAQEKKDTQNKKIAAVAGSLQTDSQTLQNLDFDTASEEAIEKAVTSFVDSYNSVITSSSSNDSTNKTVLRNALWTTNLTNAYEDVLSKVGIKVEKDNTLSLDKESLKNASKSSLKLLFHGTLSYASKVQCKAGAILNASSSNSKSATYTKTGTYTNSSTSNVVDTLT